MTCCSSTLRALQMLHFEVGSEGQTRPAPRLLRIVVSPVAMAIAILLRV